MFVRCTECTVQAVTLYSVTYPGSGDERIHFAFSYLNLPDKVFLIAAKSSKLYLRKQINLREEMV